MASVAVVRCFLLLVAGHAGSHADIAFFRQDVSFTDGSVATFTCRTSFGVDAMGEEDEAGGLVDTLPLDFRFVGCGFGQCLDV